MSDLSLKSLFFSNGGGAAGALDEKLTHEDAALVALKSNIEAELPKLSWKTVEKEMGSKVSEVLSIGLDDIFFAAWKKYQGLAEYADPVKHPAEETALVPLATHSVKSTHSPHVDLLIKDVPIGTIQLDVQLTLTLEGVVLKVQGGKIWDICAGSCRAAGTLKGVLKSRLGSKEILSVKRESPKLSLPGAVHLANGVAIPTLRGESNMNTPRRILFALVVALALAPPPAPGAIAETPKAGTTDTAAPRRLKRETVAVTLDSGTTGLITSLASVSASTAEARPGNEAAAEKTTVTSRADLAITVTDTIDPVIAGEPLSYVVTVANAGPSDARYVEVTATPSQGAAAVATHGCTEDPTGVPLCSLGTIPAGGSKHFTLEVLVQAGTAGKITQQASVSSQTMEVKPGDESAAEETVVGARADLAISVADSTDPMIDGRPMSYTVIVTNSGPSDAQGVTVADTLPPGVTFASTTGCAEDPGGAPACSLGAIAAGTSKWYTLAVTVEPGTVGTVVNQASVSAKTTEAKPGNEAAQEDTLVEMRSELRITAGDSADPVIAGTSLTYSVKVANSGPSDALGVVVEDTLPAGVTVASTSGCAEDPGGVPTCTLGTVPAGTAKQYLIVMTVSPDRTGTITNQAKVTATTAGAGSANNAVMEETRIDTRADLVLGNRDSVDPVIAGNPLAYTVTVANNGPSDARDVVVAGGLPEGVTFRATEGCAEDSKPGGGLPACTLGTIPAGGSKLYTISVLVHPDATGVITNQAAVKSSTPEQHPGDEATPRR